MPNLMVALPNIGGILCSMPQSLTDAHYWMPCSNAAKTQNPLKFIWVTQTPEPISAVSGPKFIILSHFLYRRYCCLTSFFPIVNTCLSCKDMARQSCAMVPRWRFLCPVFPASRAQHVSDLHSKFTVGPHHVPKYGRHPISDRCD